MVKKYKYLFIAKSPKFQKKSYFVRSEKLFFVCEGNYNNPMWSQTSANHQIKEYMGKINENKDIFIKFWQSLNGKLPKRIRSWKKLNLLPHNFLKFFLRCCNPYFSPTYQLFRVLVPLGHVIWQSPHWNIKVETE